MKKIFICCLVCIFCNTFAIAFAESGNNDGPSKNFPKLAEPISRYIIYPAQAMLYKITGDVTLQVKVNPDGKATEGRIIKSSGYGSLDRAALEAVPRMEFINEDKITCYITIPIVFSLSK